LRNKKLAVVALGLGLLSTAICAASAVLPELRAERVRRAPKIDGVLDDACWRSAAQAGAFVAGKENVPAEVQTEAYLAYDNQKLYVGFRCDEPAVQGLRAVDVVDQFWAKGANDAVLVFVSPREKGMPYYQLGVNSKGVPYERGHLAERNVDLPGTIEARVQTQEASWTAEIAIPFQALGVGEQMGEVWRLNLTRVRAQSEEESSWAPVSGVWRRPERFGLLKGLIIGGKPRDARVYIRETVLGPALVGENVARLTLKARKDVRLKAVATVQAGTGEVTRRTRAVALKRREVKDVVVPYEIPVAEGFHTLTVTLVDAEAGDLLYESPPATLNIPPFSLLESSLAKNYYTSEDVAELLLRTRLPNEKLDSMHLKILVYDTGGEKVLETGAALRGRQETVTFPIRKLAAGDYEIRVRLNNRSGRTVTQAREMLRKLTPAPGGGMKIDRVRRCFVVNGEPTFLIGGDFAGLGKLDLLRDAGFNFMHGLEARVVGIRNVDDVIDSLSRAGAADLGVAAYVFHPGGWYRKGFGSLCAGAAELVEKIRNFPNLRYYEVLGNTISRETDLHRELLETIRQADPYHPVGLFFSRKIGSCEGFDFVGLNDYWPLGAYAASTPEALAAQCSEAAGKARERGMPLLYLQVSGRWGAYLREQTAREQRLQAYLALICGAKGIGWFFTQHDAPEELGERWPQLCRLVSELNQLAPVLTERAPEQTVKRQGRPEPSVHVLAQVHESKLYIVTANASQEAVNAEISVGAPASRGGVAKVLFEDRDCRLVGGVLRDEFSGYATHVYEMPLDGRPAEPFEIVLKRL